MNTEVLLMNLLFTKQKKKIHSERQKKYKKQNKKS